MASSAHRLNILDRSVIETGIGVARASSGELYSARCSGRGARFD